MKRLCIIPARGGSKRLPKKNIKLLKIINNFEFAGISYFINHNNI